jgi:iron complex transport system substrate-binding protein
LRQKNNRFSTKKGNEVMGLRVVSLCPSNTELLAYLECLDFLVGVDDYSDWPAAIQNLPRVGPDLNIRMDLVEDLQPDLVIASLSVPGMEKNIMELQKKKLPYIVLHPHSLHDIKKDLVMLGKALKVEKRAEKVVHQYDAFVKLYQETATKISYKPTLYWEWWPKPVFTPGGTNWLTEMSALAGCVNLFGHMDKANVQTEWEEVKKREPDHICLAWVGVQTNKVNPSILFKRPGWSEMKAMKNNNIHVLEEALYCRPSPRLLLGLKQLAALIHPDWYPSFDGADPLLGE